MCLQITNTVAYTFAAIGLILDLIGVIGLFINNQKWLDKIETTKPIGKIYVERENLSETDRILNKVVESLPRPMTTEEKIDGVIDRINNINAHNGKIHRRSKKWLIAIILGSLSQIVSAGYFLYQAFCNN